MKRYFLQALMSLILYAAALSCFYGALQSDSLMGGIVATSLTIIFVFLGTHILFYEKSPYKFFYEWGEKIMSLKPRR